MYKKFFLICVLVAVTLTSTQFAAADYTLTNNSATETAWVVYSLWRPTSGGWPAGWRTQGYYHVEPGATETLQVPAGNTWVYFRVERLDGTVIKPSDYLTRDSAVFWIHPFEAFTVVETDDGTLLKSDVNASDLEWAELYQYRNGGNYTIPASHQDMVRLIYFRPNDLRPLQGIETKLNRLIKDTRQFFASEMQQHGFGRKTFTFETDQNGQPLIHWVDGQFADTYYHTQTDDKVLDEIREQFDLSQDIHLIFTDITSEFLDEEGTCGLGWSPAFEEWWEFSGERWVIVPAFGECLTQGRALSLVAHELGHAFGLEHNFRSDAYIMSYGNTPDQLAECSAGWLDASKFFATRSVFSDELTTIDEPMFFESPPNAISVRFRVTDLDGLHQAQLLVQTTAADPSDGIKLYGCISLVGYTGVTVEFVVPKTAVQFGEDIALLVIDELGNTERLNYVPVRGDVLPAFLKPLAAPPTLSLPKETALLSNYPNPFNPETWMPYQLAKPAEVTVTIYAADGKLVRTLAVGHQPAGVYQSKSRAAYWDGRNEVGEPVASGVYFYTLKASDFTATRKMLIRK